MTGFVADSKGHTTAGPTITWDEYDSLKARVRELEARAAADAEVVAAAEAVRAVVSYRDRQWDVVEWDALDAALAARKGE